LLLAPNSKDDLEEIRRGEEAHRLDDLDPSEVTTKNVCESVPNGVHGEIDLLVRPPVKKIVNDDDGSLDVLHEAAPKVKKGSAAPEGDGLQTRPRIVGEFNVGKGFFRKHGGGGTVDVEVRRVEQVEEDGEFEGMFDGQRFGLVELEGDLFDRGEDRCDGRRFDRGNCG